MRFKDLVEGKVYNISNSNNNLSYKLVDNLLFNIEENEYSYNSMIEIAHHDFTEVIEYHTFEEAIEHMKKGGKTTFNNKIYMIGEYEYLQYSPIKNYTPTFRLDMLKPKWQLL